MNYRIRLTFITFVMQFPFSVLAFATVPEGFISIAQVSEFNAETKNTLQNSVFKIQIGDLKEMHGTAFVITSAGHLLTNVHNIRSCLTEHGLENSGYDGSLGELECTKLTLISSENEIVGPVKLVASYPYNPASGQRIEVAVIKSSSPVVLRQTPLVISKSNVPVRNLFAVGYAGKTTRSVREISKQIRKLNQVMQLSVQMENEIKAADPATITTDEMVKIYFKFLQSTSPLVKNSNLLSKEMMPENLSKWLTMTPAELKIQMSELITKYRPLLFSYTKMLESFKFSQYRKGFIKSYPDADNTLKSAFGTLHREDSPGTWLVRGDGRPGSSGSPFVDADGVVHGIVFAIGLVSNDVRNGCTADLEFSDWESGNYSTCNNTGILMVGAGVIRQSLENWQVH